MTAFEQTALLAERVQNISIYTVYIDMFCTRSAKSAVGSKAVTHIFFGETPVTTELFSSHKLRPSSKNDRW